MTIERNILIEQARERGIHLTRDKLAKWQQAGLIEPARLVYGQGRGARAYYADDTLERAALISSQLQKTRDIDRVRLMMWRLGYPVSARPVFEQAIALIRGLKLAIELDRNELDKEDSEHIPLYERPLDTDKLPLARKLHKRFKVRYEALVYLLYQLFDGDVLLSKEEVGALSALFQTFNLPFDIPNLAARVNEFSSYVQPDNLEEVLTSSSDGALRQSDAQWRALLQGFERIYNVTRLLLGKKSGELFDFENQPPDVQAFAILAFHTMMMRVDVRRNYERLIDAFKPLQSI